MKERPMLMSAPMVRAILAGGKSQTRRVVKQQPVDLWPEGVACYSDARGPFRIAMSNVRARLYDSGLAYDAGCEFAGPIVCPYGQPGDRLWVREAFGFADDLGHPSTFEKGAKLLYRADAPAVHSDMRWKPSIHMPRIASRITLEIVSVRVERLQEISEADAIAEGLIDGGKYWYGNPDKPVHKTVGPIHAYRDLWESINGPGSWDANPFVWVVEFKRVTP